MDGQEAAFFDDDEPSRPLLPPEDRLWRHPSELAMLAPPRRRHRPSISPLVIAPLVVVGVAGALIVAIVVAGPSTSRHRLRPSEAASVTPLTVSSIVSAVSAVPTIAPAPTTTALRVVTPPVTTAPVAPTTTPTSNPVVAVAATASGAGVLSDGTVSIPAVDLHDRFIVAAFDVAPDPDASWTVTDEEGVSRPAHLVGYVAAVRLAVMSVDTVDGDDPSSVAALPAAPWADEQLWVGASVIVGGHEGSLVSMGNEPAADGLALEHALVAETTANATPDNATPANATPSTGDLVWFDGKIVGLVVHRGEGQVLAIPSSLVKAAATSMINGTPELAWLGVSVTGNEHGEITVSAVNPTSPAAGIGLRVGDIIRSVNGTDVASPADLVAEVWRCGAGHDADITVTRDGESLMLDGQLAAMPVNA